MQHRLYAPLLPVAIFLTAGIAAGRFLSVPMPLSLLLPAASGAAALLFFRWPRCQTALLWLATMLLGMHLAAHPLQLPEPALLHATRQHLLGVRSLLTAHFRQAGLEGEAYAITSAMALGDKSAMTPDMRSPYDTTGASHVLALSGLHLGIIYWLVTVITVGRRWRFLSQVVTVLAIWAFTLLTGLAPSTVRSATMLTVLALMRIGYRRHASVNVLAFTAVVMLLITPSALFDIGFQLSFLSVLSILLFQPVLEALVPLPFQQRHPLLRAVWAITVVSLSAQLGAAPLIAYYFHRFSPWFLLANAVVLPEAYLLLLGALLLLLTASPLVATALTVVTATAGRMLAALAQLPLATVQPLYPTLAQTLLLYVVVACLYVVVTRVTNARWRL